MNTARRFVLRSRPVPRPWWLAFLVLLVLAIPAYAQQQKRDADNPLYREPPPSVEELEEDLWKESPILLPRFPSAEFLLPLRHEEIGTDYRYYVDVTSVSREGDDVIRYTVVIQSPGGSSNIYYEGIRCATDEVKTYAYGTRGGRFARLADPKWTHVYSSSGTMAYRALLARRYICDENGWARDTDSVLEQLVKLDPRRPPFTPKPADTGQ